MFSMEIGLTVFALGALVGSAHFFGYFLEKMHQPRLVGEILAGIVLGPFVLGSLRPELTQSLFGGTNIKIDSVLSFFYQLGLMLLMFISGSQSCHVISRHNRKITAWLVGIGTVLPFLTVYLLVAKSIMPMDAIIGPANHGTAALLILSIAVAVTSIPVISRVFYDLKILKTRFAGVVIGAAIFEDIILWGVLAVATALIAFPMKGKVLLLGDVGVHISVPILFMVFGLTVMPSVLRWLHSARWNILFKSSPIGYVILILLIYTEFAYLLDVNVVFAAFLAGFGMAGGVRGNQEDWFRDSADAISKFSLAFFIPIYFALVGCKLVFGREFSPVMLVVFFLGSSLLAFICTGIAAYGAGFRKLDIVNLAMAKNARGGPGIVLASVAFDVGIINGAFYTTLVLTAIMTSQIAGTWLRYVLKKGWPLLQTT